MPVEQRNGLAIGDKKATVFALVRQKSVNSGGGLG